MSNFTEFHATPAIGRLLRRSLLLLPLLTAAFVGLAPPSATASPEIVRRPPAHNNRVHRQRPRTLQMGPKLLLNALGAHIANKRHRAHRDEALDPDTLLAQGETKDGGPATSLSDEDLRKEIAKVGNAIDMVNKELAETRTKASYPGVDAEPLRRGNKAKYDKRKKETEAKKKRLDAEHGAELQRKRLPGGCDTCESAEKLPIKEKYDQKKKKLDDDLQDYKDKLDDDLILKHGDGKSRKNIKKLNPKLKSLRNRQAKLEAEQQKRFNEADERAKKTPLPDDDDDGPLIPEEDINESGER